MGKQACAPSFVSVVVLSRQLQRIWCAVDGYDSCGGLAGTLQFERVQCFVLLSIGRMRLRVFHLLHLRRMLRPLVR